MKHHPAPVPGGAPCALAHEAFPALLQRWIAVTFLLLAAPSMALAQVTVTTAEGDQNIDESSAEIGVRPFDDELVEGDETVVITLEASSDPEVPVGTPSAATLTIVDDDGDGIFVEDGNNSVASAAGAPGECPPPR